MSVSIRLSHFLADLFVAKGWIGEDGKIAYVVGLDVLFSTAIDWTAIGVLALLRGRLPEAVVYLLFFLTVRRYSGGYHASTRTGCFAIFVGSYLFSDLVTAAIYESGSGLFLGIYSVCSMVVGELVFHFLTPVKNDRKKYTEEWLAGAKKKAFLCLNIWYCAAACLIALGSGMGGEIIAAGNIVVLLILMRKRRNRK